jgi:hypothetical protein
MSGGLWHGKRRADSDSIDWNDYPRIVPGEYRAYCKWGKQ